MSTQTSQKPRIHRLAAKWTDRESYNVRWLEYARATGTPNPEDVDPEAFAEWIAPLLDRWTADERRTRGVSVIDYTWEDHQAFDRWLTATVDNILAATRRSA